MKQKYLITKDQENQQIKIQEFAELDKDIFSLVCEESYDGDKIEAAVSEGKETLIEILRTPNLYPVAEYADKIADSVSHLFNQTDQPSVEITFDDIEALKKEKAGPDNENDDESVAIDDLLNNNLDEEEEKSDSDEKDAGNNSDDSSEVSNIDEDALDLFDNEDDNTDENNNK
ncbi:MAG: hypothetical protein KGY61_03450 [Desulfobacterales bacterium]|nr:hypothetical protein [Desulfobacterales bacterium]